MEGLRVALVSMDPATRLAAARAFDAAPMAWSLELCAAPPPSADVVLWGPDLARDGDPVFDPGEADRLLGDIEEAARAPASSKVVVVTSASGGAGTTTVALHLAAAWPAGTPWYVEWGSGLGGAASRLGLAEGDTRTWADVDGTEGSLLLSALPVPGGFRAVLAPTQGERPEDLLARTGRAADVVIVDAGASSDRASALAGATCGVVLVPPTPAAAVRARAFLDQQPTIDWALLLSRTGGGGDMTRARLSAALGRSVALELPHTPRLRDAELDGQLLTRGWSRWGSRITRLAYALERL